MKTLTVAVDEEYIKTLDFVIKSSKMYSSRSEFIKDAVREKVSELVKLNEDLKEIRAAAKRMAKKAKERGWDGSLISKKERDKWAKEYMKSL
ncbi:ribbon-helix-helix domain-containing protein [Candidatus Micrarchaeota archaeon]|nr:ribbon-helix-helix domain-containing protein [Candidatus Micrarchaeota archaeon]